MQGILGGSDLLRASTAALARGGLGVGVGMGVCTNGGAMLDRLLATPRFELGTWPTPIETIASGSAPAVLVKRDDLSGWGRGGAKARKIEHVVGHLRAMGRDELVTVVGNITNLAFDLLPALDRAEIRASIFVLDDPPTPPEERERIFRGVRDRITLLGPSRLEAVRAIASRWLASRREGHRPFWALPGMSHPAGIIGNARGFIEMALQRVAEGRPLPRTVYVSAATGTTIAGFLLGEHALRAAGLGLPPTRIVGVQVYPGAMKRSVRLLLEWASRSLDLKTRVPSDRIEIETSELHGGFGSYSDALADRCGRLVEETGLAVDPIFGGKTWAAMEKTNIRESAPDESILYWHCGYTPEWSTLGRAAMTPNRASRTSTSRTSTSRTNKGALS